MRRGIPLFSEGPLHRHCENLLAGARKAAAQLPMDVLEDEDRAVSDLRGKYELARVELGEAATAVEDHPPGQVLITVAVPFTGNSTPLRFMPSSFTSNPPEAQLWLRRKQEGPAILLEYGPLPSAQLDPDTVKQWRERELDDLRKWTAWINQDLEAFSTQLAEVVRQAVQGRKADLIRQQSLRDELS
jgi:hypothetical protein